MRISDALVTTSTLPFSLTPARAEVYPTLPFVCLSTPTTSRFRVNVGRCGAHTPVNYSRQRSGSFLQDVEGTVALRDRLVS
jgi:hypothetical protein